MLDVQLASEALMIARLRQTGHVGVSSSSGRSSPTKMRAKARATEICRAHGASGKAIDIGGEECYRTMFEAAGVELWPLNLPHDMHALDAVRAFDGALAMHVLEHSPFPLYLLLSIRRALKRGGWLYVAVPHPSRRWVRNRAHFTVLAPDGWHQLIESAGYRIVHRESGKLERRRSAVEERFLCLS